MNNETQVSGAIFAKLDTRAPERETYVIRGRSGGWGLPVNDLQPDDLRVLADRIEQARAKLQK